jgi:LPS export ABC transporter protein LptC
MKRLKLNRWLISLFLLIMLVLVFTPENKIVPITVKTNLTNSDYFMEGIVVHQYNPSGKKINTLSAKRLEHSSIDDIATLEHPKLTFNKSDSGKWHLYSNKGRLLNNSTTIELADKVTIEEVFDPDLLPEEKSKGTNVQTSMITYNLSIDLEKNIASTTESVLISSPFYQTKSTGLNIDFDKEIILLSSNVSTEIYQ